MPLAPGARLGPYEVVSQIGAGGMGEIYKARDPKLDRFVALKVLPPALGQSGDLLARFEREAKAVAALNHPNILGIYDFGREGDHAYAVMELLEGDSLRERLKAGALAPKRAIEIARQMAEGLAAAHARGIIHRDIKPENVMLTKDGHVKVLDFGLAKQLPPLLPGIAGEAPARSGHDSLTRLSSPGFTFEAPAESSATSAAPSTFPTEALGPLSGGNTQVGAILGTVGYMAPEQVRGESADHRADIFALGVVLYEMLAGRKAFLKPSPSLTLQAIQQEDPPELTASKGLIPPALERLVFHCLEKEPARRFQSMQDLAYDLANLSSLSTPVAAEVRALARKGASRALLVTLAAVVLAGLGLGAAGLLHLGRPDPPPTFQRLSFVPGTIEAACFAPDGETVYFSQRVAGGRPELFVLHPSDPEPRPLGIADALLLGVSPSGELAFLRNPRLRFGGRYQGLLARAPGGGGAQRDQQEDVAEAVWDGEGLATLSVDDQVQFHLEFPAGRPLLSGPWNTRTLRLFRLSRDGAQLALLDSDAASRTEIVTYDRKGTRTSRFTKAGDGNGDTFTGLAWGPEGDLWVSELQGDQTEVWTLSPSGRRRVLWHGAGTYQLMDVSPKGRVLLTHHQVRRGVLTLRAGEAQPRDLSVFGSTQAKGLSADGRHLLLLESPVMEGGTPEDTAYLRPLDGGPALRLGRGLPQTLSADGRWVHMDLAALPGRDLDPAWVQALQAAGLRADQVGDPVARSRYLLFVPTGLGRPFALALPPDHGEPGYAFLLPDGQHVVCPLTIKGQEHWVLLDRKGGPPRRVTGEGLGLFYAGLMPLSPDATRLVVSGNSRDWFIQPLEGGTPTPIRGMAPGERAIGWNAEGTALYLRPELSVLPVTLTRLDLRTGARQPVIAFMPPDPAGHLQTRGVFMTPDARTFAFTYDKKLSELYRVEGLK